jgi:hypothetical protein
LGYDATLVKGRGMIGVTLWLLRRGLSNLSPRPDKNDRKLS